MLKRVFIALDIAKKNKQEIALWREQHLSLSYQEINQDNFHITLNFIGLINDEQQATLIQAISNAYVQLSTATPPFSKSIHTAQLTQLGLFKRPQVLYASIYPLPNWLVTLQLSITTLIANLSNIGSDPSFSQHSIPYIPHLSLYRKAKSQPPTSAVTLNLTLTTFSLYHSYSTNNGVIYEPIHTWLI
jgi:2'-5' RNA ligase